MPGVTAPHESGDDEVVGSRWLPPVYSPLVATALVRATSGAVGWGRDPRPVFAASLAEEFGASSVLLTDSGTHALQLGIQAALRAVPAADAPVVALPAYSCFDVATAAVATGACIALYDVSPDTLSPNLDSLARVLELGARVVVVAPLYGMSVDWDAIEQCAAPFGAMVIEDAAQGHGATWRESRLGALGRLGVLSFGRGKGWTGGSGGALLVRAGALPLATTDFPPDLPAAGSAGTLVSASAQWLLARPSLYRVPASVPLLHLGETRYHEPSPAQGMARAAASLLLATRSLAVREAEARRAHAAEYAERVASIAAVRMISPIAGGTSGFLRFPIRVERGMLGISARGAAARLGLAPGYPSTLAQLPAVRRRMPSAAAGDRWPGADELVDSLLTLPTHSRVTERERQAIVRLLSRYDPRAVDNSPE